jgi:hypothetical protein
MLKIRIPTTFLPKLESPKLELGEADDPMSQWVFGKKEELFRYKFQGLVNTQSGWVSLITWQALKSLQEKPSVQWDDLKDSAESNEGLLQGSRPQQPFLFVGQILEAAAASVYLSYDGPAEVSGMLIASSE